MYALLPGRSEDTYRRLFTSLTNIVDLRPPNSILTDFELAAMKAFQHQFPDTALSGCHFHFGQCIWRQLQADGFAAAYNSNPAFAKTVKQLIALAFVPADDVIHAFEALTADDSYRQIDSLVNYFEDNFVGRLRRNRRVAPRFSIKFWNMYDRVVQNLPRSNNAVEGWHNAFNNSVGIAHPTVPNLSRKLQVEQHNMLLVV